MTLSKYMKPRGIRYEPRTIAGRFRGGKLAPVMAVPFMQSESGKVDQTLTFELDPVAGRLISTVSAQVTCVFVPVQAIDALQNPDEDFVGSAESVRLKLLSGAPLFDVEPEGELTKRMAIAPQSVGGVKYVTKAARLAHNAAVNFLRRRKYVNAEQLLASSTAMTSALVGKTVLDRLNGVLDPEDRVNGAVSLDQQITLDSNYYLSTLKNYKFGRQPDGTTYSSEYDGYGVIVGDSPFQPLMSVVGGGASDVSLTDFYTAERMDALTREMRKLVDDNPQYGEELVTRFAHGLSVDMGDQPIVVYDKEVPLGFGLRRAMDGASLDVSQTDLGLQLDYSVVIPPTEFGGILITFASIKPDEALADQPHPVLSKPWGAINFVADELAMDPVPVPVRELYADCGTGDEETVALYVGNNHLLKNYVNYGFNRHVDQTTLENKTAIWQYPVPMSVTPQSVIYPADIVHDVFEDHLAEVCTYTVNSVASINTPVIFGPTPVEELAAIETADVFDDAE